MALLLLWLNLEVVEGIRCSKQPWFEDKISIYTVVAIGLEGVTFDVVAVNVMVQIALVFRC